MFVSPADLFILDEPSAAMDPKAESELYEALLHLSENKSCILISHRLGSTRICDRILVLSDGRIIEQGSHNELMAQNGEYANMFRSQSSWYVEDQSEKKVS